ncbi:MAG: PqqD family protein [Desulfocapsa sp.]|nr:PqqD family protein [Desulfocapsa sp.]
MIDKNQVFLLSTDVLSQEIDGESVLLDMKSENYFGLNEVGSKVLTSLKDGASLDQLVASLLDTYEVETKELETDISELLLQLLDAGLITPKAT